MTTEHKILHLVDRGIVNVTDVCTLIGTGSKREGKRLHDKGFTEWTVEPYLKLTSKGVERLNELDLLAIPDGWGES